MKKCKSKYRTQNLIQIQRIIYTFLFSSAASTGAATGGGIGGGLAGFVILAIAVAILAKFYWGHPETYADR